MVHTRLKENDNEFALKVVEKLHVKRENKVKYVMMERNIMSSVSHPLIVKLYYSFQDPDYLFFCMDVAHGGELSAYIRMCRDKAERKEEGCKRACSEDAARFYVGELLAALSYLHSCRIIHRDVKPDNILIHRNGHLKLTDFGTALQLKNSPEDAEVPMDDEEEDEALVERTSFVGTADYVSPEVLSNEAVTGACDLWAVGVVLYNMLTGTTPFASASEFLTFQNITAHAHRMDRSGKRVRSSITFPDHISASARDCIWGLMQGKTSDRLGYGGVEGSWDAYLKEDQGTQKEEDVGANDAPGEESEDVRVQRSFSDSISSLKRPCVAMSMIDPTYPALQNHSFFGPLDWGETFECVQKAGKRNGVFVGTSSSTGTRGKGEEVEGEDSVKTSPPLWECTPPYVPSETTFPTRSGKWRDGSQGWTHIDDDVMAFQMGKVTLSYSGTTDTADASSDSAPSLPSLEVFGKRASAFDDPEVASSLGRSPSVLTRLLGRKGASQSHGSRADSSAFDPDAEDTRPRGESFMLEGDRTKWHSFADEGERIVFTSLVWKKRGLFTKKRQLILTDRPRLMYVDPEAMKVMGEVPWSLTEPVQPIVISESKFDVHSHTNGRTYHFTAVEGVGSSIWCDLIEAALFEYGLKDITPSDAEVAPLVLDVDSSATERESDEPDLEREPVVTKEGESDCVGSGRDASERDTAESIRADRVNIDGEPLTCPSGTCS